MRNIGAPFEKYRRSPAIERTYSGIVFGSKLEMNRYIALELAQKAGKIRNLKCQVPFVLLDKFEYRGAKHRAITYVADFTYDNAKAEYVIEDTKGMLTPVYKIKMKLFLNNIKDIQDVFRFCEIFHASDIGGIE